MSTRTLDFTGKTYEQALAMAEADLKLIERAAYRRCVDSFIAGGAPHDAMQAALDMLADEWVEFRAKAMDNLFELYRPVDERVTH
ncbi:hypothetical protein ACSBOB_18610 [Mesorhizobium sp. ASY16-5R]|uniref:hypothetical protein n=1 Tax=Mesorhizobium sp. ASY16-5R TaxID=3445772 RepID=UPI003F9F63AB